MKNQPSKHLQSQFGLALLLGLLITSNIQAQLTLPAYESFDYPNNERIGLTGGSSVTNWTTALNSTGTGSVVTTNGFSMSYPGLPAPVGIVAWYSPITPSSGRNRGLPFTSQTLSAGNPTVYYSFLLNVQANPSGLKQIFALSSAAGSLSTAMTLFLTPDGRVAVGKNSSTAASVTNSAALAAGTHLIVVRYKFITGTANDELAVWVDPGSLGVAEGSVPAASATATSGTDATTLASIAIVHQATPTPPGNFYVDELRIGLTWASVTPSSCTPGTTFNVTGGGSLCAGDSGVSVGLANSESGRDYQLKRNGTDVGAALPGTGAALDFGLQNVGGTYTVVASNTTTTCIGSMGGNAIVTVNIAPSIGTQPNAQNPALGGSASFSVVASGAGLSYQWRRDGTNLSNGGNISGATSATLTVNPVAAADGVPALNGYDVIVSGTCSPAATSTRVALTVAIPNNLIWVGGGANLWDTTTANWTGDATIFVNNDNVTFNNSGSASPAVDLVGVIAPNAITVTGTQNYTLGTTTSGSIGGVATLTKSGSGTLTLSTTNTFTGKSAVNGGTLSITTGSNLGTAPGAFVADQLTLNGGRLQVTASGSITGNRGTTLGVSGGTYEIPTAINHTNTAAITGTGSLTKMGDGSLVLNAAHSYAGGTVISNGTVILLNANGLGSGTATLAGGTLSFPAATTITNGVQVSENSTLTFATTGNSAVVLNGDLAGASGRTLTVTPTGASTVSGTRVRINNGLTNSITVNSDINLNGTFTFATYNNQGDQTYNGVISGAGTLGRRSPTAGVAGNTILTAANTYSGGTVIADGGIGFGIDSVGSPVVTSGPIGAGTLSFENNVNTFKRLYAVGGARTVGNAILWSSVTNQNLTIEGNNALTLSGAIDLGGTNRSIITSNTANTTLSGAISNGGLTKTAPGTLLLNGTATVSEVIVAEGTLGGNGTITGPVTVNSGATLAPGTSIGTLTINGTLNLAGNTSIEVNKTAGTKDLITGVSTLTYGGTLAVANLSGTLTAGDSFVIASATTPVGNFASIIGSPGAGLNWNFNPATGTLSVVSSAPPTLGVSQSGSTLTFTWAGAFKLQAQTNDLSTGITGTWFDYPGGNSSPVNTTINPANGSVFYRLINQ